MLTASLKLVPAERDVHAAKYISEVYIYITAAHSN